MKLVILWQYTACCQCSVLLTVSAVYCLLSVQCTAYCQCSVLLTVSVVYCLLSVELKDIKLPQKTVLNSVWTRKYFCGSE
jgi:hypothetical protein